LTISPSTPKKATKRPPFCFLHVLSTLFLNTVTYNLLHRGSSFWYPFCQEVSPLPRNIPYRIALTKQERKELKRRANKYTLPYFIVARAKMILLAQQGLSNDQIADRLCTRREIVSRWRKRFFEKRLAGLEDRHRPGRPRVFPPQNWSCALKPSPANCPIASVCPFLAGAWAELGAHVRTCGLTASVSDT